jgi:Bacterial PH domain
MPDPPGGARRPECKHGRVTPAVQRFRYPAAISVAAIVTSLGATPMLLLGWYAVPIPLVPLLVAVWGWRAGTDADANGLRIRALFASRRLPWRDIAEVAAGPDGRVAARLESGAVLRLPAVRRDDLHRLVRATEPPRDQAAGAT